MCVCVYVCVYIYIVTIVDGYRLRYHNPAQFSSENDSMYTTGLEMFTKRHISLSKTPEGEDS